MTKTKPKADVERDRLLGDFGLITEADLAVLLKVDVRTLRNRPQRDLPPFTKAGAQRMFFKEDVVHFLQMRKSRP